MRRDRQKVHGGRGKTRWLSGAAPSEILRGVSRGWQRTDRGEARSERALAPIGLSGSGHIGDRYLPPVFLFIRSPPEAAKREPLLGGGLLSTSRFVNISNLHPSVRAIGAYGLTDKPPKPDVIHQPQQHESRQSTRTTCAHERQRDPGHWHHSGYHPYVHQQVKQ